MSTKGPASTSTTSYPGWLSDAGQGLLNAASQVAMQPYQPYTGPRVAELTPTQNAAIGGYGQLAQGVAPLYGTASGTLGNILQGAQNPYMQHMFVLATQDATQAYNQAVAGTSGRFNTPGNWDSARHDMRDELNQRALATGLGNSIGSIEAGQFNTSNQMALQGLSGLNSTLGAGTSAINSALQGSDLQRQQMQQVYNTGYNDYLEQRQYPWQQLQNLSSLFTGARGAAGSTTTNQQGYDPISQGIGLWTLGSSLGNSGSKGGNASAGS